MFLNSSCSKNINKNCTQTYFVHVVENCEHNQMQEALQISEV